MSRRRSLIMLPVVLTLLASFWQLNKYDFNNISPIEKVEIEGEFENILPDVFRKQVLAVIDGGYFSLDLKSMRVALLDLPWVDDVSVRRQWPSALNIKVTEKMPVAYWNDDALISNRGDVFKPDVINQQLALPKLNGPVGFHNKMWRFLVAIDKDFSLMEFDVIDLSLDDRRAWSLRVLSRKELAGIELKLGRDHVEERLARFVRVFSGRNSFNLTNTAVIDLRYPNGFAMKIKNNNASRLRLVTEA